MPRKFSPDVRAKAVRLVREHREDYASEWEAIVTVAGRLGMSAETLRKWVRQAEVDEGGRDGVTTETARQIRELKRKNADLERTMEVLKTTTSFFARDLDPPRICSAGSSTPPSHAPRVTHADRRHPSHGRRKPSRKSRSTPAATDQPAHAVMRRSTTGARPAERQTPPSARDDSLSAASRRHHPSSAPAPAAPG